MSSSNNFMRPRDGESVHFVCLKCSAHFLGKLHREFLIGLELPTKCPKCGSYKTRRDPAMRY